MSTQNTKLIEYVVSDCRSEEGITIGLIDTIINSSRILAKRPLDSDYIKSALKDLSQDEDLKFILNYLNDV